MICGLHISENPELEDAVKKVLSQPSSSMTERSRSTYSYNHYVKQNRLNCKRVDTILFIHSNILLQSRFQILIKFGPDKRWDMNPDTYKKVQEMVWEDLDDEGVKNIKEKKAAVELFRF